MFPDVFGRLFVNGFKQSGQTARYRIVAFEGGSQAAMARYRQFLSGGGKVVNDLAAPGQGGFAGKEDSYGNIVAVRSGRNIAMILGTLSENEAKRLVTELVGNIR
jgi:hypothetical protein